MHGVTSQPSGALAFAVDTAPPAAPALSLANNTGAVGDGTTADGHLAITGQEAGAALAPTLDGSAVATYDAASLAPGGHTVSVTQTDLAGNVSAAGTITFRLDAYVDVAKSGLDPLAHYDAYGWKEGRDPSAGFDTRSYGAHNPDVAAADIDPLQHFLAYGIHEGRGGYADGHFG